MSQEKTQNKKQRVDDLTKMLAFGFVGFSISQLLGFLNTAFNFWQASLLFLLLIIIALFPGIIEHSATQAKFNGRLHKPLIISLYMPSMVLISILFIGFIIGWIVAL